MYDYAGKSEEEQERTEDIKSYTRSVSHVDENHGKKKKIIQLKIGLGKMRKRSRACVICYHKIFILKNS